MLGWAQVEARDAPARAHPERALRPRRRPLRAVRSPTTGGCASRRRRSTGSKRDCDEANAALPELSSFVLPGGTEAAARLHVARAVCRRAEREVLAAARARPVNPLALVYLNRLWDLLFILARAANAGGGEPLWRPGGDADRAGRSAMAKRGSAGRRRATVGATSVRLRRSGRASCSRRSRGSRTSRCTTPDAVGGRLRA